MKSLPLTYNRDMQEDKESVFDSIDTALDIVNIMIKLLPGIKPKKDSMENALKKGFITATDLADYLTRKGLSFREAHKVVGNIVAYAEEHSKRLEELSIDELKNFSDLIKSDVLDILHYRKAIDSRKSYGGTAKENVMDVIKEIEKELEKKGGDVIECPRCGYPVKVYKNPIPTVDIIILIDSKVLLIRRKNEPFGWAIPGGFVDFGESVEDAAVREAKEETGLDVELVRLVGVYSSPERDPRTHTISTVFYAKANGKPKAGDDAMDLELFEKDNLPEDIVFDHKKILGDFFESIGL
jgi:argininosuccinate lyase